MNKTWKILLFLVGSTPFYEFITYKATRPPFITDQLEKILHLFYLSAFLFLSLIIIFYGLRKRGDKLGKGHMFLLIGIFTLYAGQFLSQKFGVVPAIDVRIIPIILFFSALLFIPTIPVRHFLGLFNKIFLFYVYGSLVAMIVIPQKTFTAYDDGFIGLSFRLNGITNHANSLGLLLSLYFLVELYLSRGKMKIVHTLFAGIALILTQSKTAWLIVIGIYGFIFIYRILTTSGRTKYLSYAFLSLVSALMVAIVWLAGIGDKITLFIESNDLSKLTGRVQVWEITTHLWQMNKMFGYGITLWDENMQMVYLPLLYWTPGHAHNQFYQTLGESGIIGVMGLAFYVVLLLAIAFKFGKTTRGISIVLMILLIMRGFTEPVFLTVYNNISFILHFFIIAFFALLLKQKKLVDSQLDHDVQH